MLLIKLLSYIFHFNNNACIHLYDYPIKFATKNCFESPNVMSTTPEIIENNGYPVIDYTVTTPDGYILTLFRIPPEDNDYRKNKQPVFIQHGIAVDSANWVHVGNRSLAFNLADQGYDVWLGNLRGTRYSREHEILEDSDDEYWNFNLDDVASNDIRTSLKTVAKESATNDSIIYIGHSKGTTLAFMYAAEYPGEAEQLLSGIVALSPVVYLDADRLTNIVLKAAPSLAMLLKMIGIPSLFYNMEEIIQYIQYLCPLFPYLCMYGFSFKSLSDEFLPDDLLVSFSNFPSTVSVTELQHFGQIHNSKQFQKYDFGKKNNLKQYGQEEPPIYQLGNITLPVFLFYGNADTFVKKSSIERVFKELGSEKKHMALVPLGDKGNEHKFNHVSFSYSKYIKQYLYDGLFKILASELPPKSSTNNNTESVVFQSRYRENSKRNTETSHIMSLVKKKKKILYTKKKVTSKLFKPFKLEKYVIQRLMRAVVNQLLPFSRKKSGPGPKIKASTLLKDMFAYKKILKNLKTIKNFRFSIKHFFKRY